MPEDKHTGGVATSDLHAAVDGHVVPVAPGLGTSAGIDPSQTDTPVQDAIDVIQDLDHSSGTVLLPPKIISEAEPIENLSRTTIQGFGMGCSQIMFPPKTHGVVSDGNKVSFAELRDLAIHGPGAGKNTGSAILFENSATRQLNLDNVTITGWNDKVIQSQVRTYECNWGKVHMWGNKGSLIHLRNWGPGNSWAMAKLNTQEGQIMDIREVGGHWDIRQINVGGIYKGVTYPFHLGFTGHGGINIGYLNFEPHSDGNDIPGSVVGLGSGHTHIQHISNHAVVEHIVEPLKNGQNWSIGTIKQKGPEVRAKIGITENQGPGPKVYQGPSTDVENRTGGRLDTPVACLGDLTLVK